MNKIAQKHIQKLYEQNGKALTPERVLEDAKQASSPLHKFFEWDDRKAAHLYRLSQARELIAYCVNVETGGREYVYVPSQSAFVAASDAVQSAKIWREAVTEMEREISVLIAAKERTMRIAPKRLQIAFDKFKNSTELNIKRLSKAASAA